MKTQDITVGSVIPRLLDLLRSEGLPEMTLGDFYAERL